MAKPVLADRRGTVFVLFSLVLPVILAGVLGIVSLFSLSTGRADLQAASDAAANAILGDLNAAMALSATPDALVGDVDKQARANAVVQSFLGARTDISNPAASVVTTPTTISVTVSARVQNIAGDLFSLPFFTSSATTTVPWLKADQLQIVMAVDSGSTSGKAAAIGSVMDTLKPILVKTIDALSATPNYPDIAVSVVPFTSQIATDPSVIVADETDSHGQFGPAIARHVLALRDGIETFLLPSANAAVTTCFDDPIVPTGTDGGAFGGTNKPMSHGCNSALPRIRPMVKISKPFVKGEPQGNETANSPARLFREDLKTAIQTIAPAGCRNLTIGVTWAMAQLPKDTNPKLIFLIANGNNSQNAHGQTSECASHGGGSVTTQAELDAEFVAACQFVRDPLRNTGRNLDLVILQTLDGNPTAFQTCANTAVDNGNYFSSPNMAALASIFQKADLHLFRAAQAQIERHHRKSWSK